MTRLCALRAVARIAHSPLRLDLSPVLLPAVETLSRFLRQQSPTLKHETVRTLEALVRNSTGGSGSSSPLPAESFVALLREVAPHISDSDLHLGARVLDLVAAVAVACPHPLVTEFIRSRELFDRVIAFLTSPLLQVNIFLLLYVL